jgi:hypothetical protein
VDLAGLFQRVAVTAGFGWLTLLAVHLLGEPHTDRKYASEGRKGA